jgi:hypothetical protein
MHAAAAQSSLHDSRGRPLVATQGRGLMPLALLPLFRASVGRDHREMGGRGERKERAFLECSYLFASFWCGVRIYSSVVLSHTDATWCKL